MKNESNEISSKERKAIWKQKLKFSKAKNVEKKKECIAYCYEDQQFFQESGVISVFMHNLTKFKQEEVIHAATDVLSMLLSEEKSPEDCAKNARVILLGGVEDNASWDTGTIFTNLFDYPNVEVQLGAIKIFEMLVRFGKELDECRDVVIENLCVNSNPVLCLIRLTQREKETLVQSSLEAIRNLLQDENAMDSFIDTIANEENALHVLASNINLNSMGSRKVALEIMFLMSRTELGRRQLLVVGLIDLLNTQTDELLNTIQNCKDEEETQQIVQMLTQMTRMYCRLGCAADVDAMELSQVITIVKGLCQLLALPLCKTYTTLATVLVETIGRVVERTPNAQYTAIECNLLQNLISLFEVSKDDISLYDMIDKLLHMCILDDQNQVNDKLLEQSADNERYVEPSQIVGMISSACPSTQYRGVRLAEKILSCSTNAKQFAMAGTDALTSIIKEQAQFHVKSQHEEANYSLIYYACYCIQYVASINQECCEGFGNQKDAVDSLVLLLSDYHAIEENDISYEVRTECPLGFQWVEGDSFYVTQQAKKEMFVNVACAAGDAVWVLSQGYVQYNELGITNIPKCIEKKDAKKEVKSLLPCETTGAHVLGHAATYIKLLKSMENDLGADETNKALLQSILRVLATICKYTNALESILKLVQTEDQNMEIIQGQDWPCPEAMALSLPHVILLSPLRAILHHPNSDIEDLECALAVLEAIFRIDKVHDAKIGTHAENFVNVAVAMGMPVTLAFLLDLEHVRNPKRLDILPIQNRIMAVIDIAVHLGTIKESKIMERMEAEAQAAEGDGNTPDENMVVEPLEPLVVEKNWGILLDISVADVRYGYESCNLLFAALAVGNEKIILELLHLKACPNSANENNISAIMLALATRVSTKVISTFLEFGCNLNTLTLSGDSVVKFSLVATVCCNIGQHVANILFQDCDSTSLDNSLIGSPYMLADILEAGADPNVSDQDGNYLIHLLLSQASISIKLGSVNLDLMYQSDMESEKMVMDLLHLLVHHGALVDKCNKFGQTPLHLAVKYGHTNAALLLLQNFGANPNVLDSFGALPLHYASMGVCYNSVHLVKQLVEHGKCYPLVVGKYLDQRKGKSAMDKRLMEVDEILQQGFAEATCPKTIVTKLCTAKELLELAIFDTGTTVVHFACGANDRNVEYFGMSDYCDNVVSYREELVDYFQSLDAAAMLQQTHHKVSALHFACMRQPIDLELSMINMLLRCEAPLNHVHDAISIRPMSSNRTLSDGTTITIEGEFALSALHYAVLHSDSLVEHLLDQNASTNPDHSDVPLLPLACFAGRSPTIIASLIDARANTRISFGTVDGTALHIAISMNDLPLVQQLCLSTDFVNLEIQRVSDSQTPLQLAYSLHHIPICLELVSSGANLFATNPNGDSLCTLIAQQSPPSILLQILNNSQITSDDFLFIPEPPNSSSLLQIIEQQNLTYASQNSPHLLESNQILQKYLIPIQTTQHLHDSFLSGNLYNAPNSSENVHSNFPATSPSIPVQYEIHDKNEKAATVSDEKSAIVSNEKDAIVSDEKSAIVLVKNEADLVLNEEALVLKSKEKAKKYNTESKLIAGELQKKLKMGETSKNELQPPERVREG